MSIGVGVPTAFGQTAAPFGSAAPVPAGPHGGAVAPLPDIHPAPSPEEAAPALSAPPSAALLDTAPRFVLHGYRIDGPSVLPKMAIGDVFAPYLNRQVSIADLEEIRTRLTKLYVDRGYINSGFLIPDQDASSGTVAFHAVEGG